VRRLGSRKGPGEIALGLVLLGVLVGLALVAQDHWKQGLSLIGVTLLAGAAMRLVLPASRVGLLVVRSRPFDVATLTLLGAAILGVTFQVPLPHR
jgi:hypothetical protein